MFYSDKRQLWRERKTYQGVTYDLSAKTRDELVTKITLRKAEIEAGKLQTSPDMVCADWSREYIEAYRLPDASPAYAVNLKSYQKLVDDHLGSMPLKAVQPIHCRQFASGLSSYSKSHASKVIAFARAMFDAAEENGLVERNPMMRVKVPAACTQGSRRALTAVEREQFLDYADEHEHGLWIKVMLLMGLRSGETERMLGKHIEIEHTPPRLFVDGTKSKKAQRYVPIPAELIAELTPYTKKPFEPVFKDQRGGAIRKGTRRRMWKAFVRGLNIKLGARVYRNEVMPPFPVATDITPHCLRHTFSTYCEERGMPLRLVAELLGHEKIGTTEDYTHLTPETFAAAAAILSEEVESL